MEKRKILGLVLMGLGVLMFVFSQYITEQISAGRYQISQGKQKVRTVDEVFSQSKYTKPFGNVFTGGAKERIRSGEAEISKYEKIEMGLKFSGVIAFLVGLWLFFFPVKRKPRLM